MKASKLIQELTKLIDDYGDLNLLFRTPQCKGYKKANVSRVISTSSPYQLFVVDLD